MPRLREPVDLAGTEAIREGMTDVRIVLSPDHDCRYAPGDREQPVLPPLVSTGVCGSIPAQDGSFALRSDLVVRGADGSLRELARPAAQLGGKEDAIHERHAD